MNATWFGSKDRRTTTAAPTTLRRFMATRPWRVSAQGQPLSEVFEVGFGCRSRSARYRFELSMRGKAEKSEPTA
jgi:hypothetical protein